MIVKLPKQPDKIFENEYLFNYILELERMQKLETLSLNIMVYYVLRTFSDEINNGGLMQYFTNTSKQTYPFLRQCGGYLNHFAFSPFIAKVCDYFDLIDITTLEGDVDQAIFNQAERFDNEYYKLDERCDFEKVLTDFYKANYSIEKIDIPKIKEPESKTCRYFTVSTVCKDAREAAESYLKVLADFSEQRWTIELWNYFDTYRIIATTYGKAVDLDMVLQNWDNQNFSFCGNHNTSYFQRMKLSSYFGTINIVSGTDGISQYQMSISPSGFVKNEKKIKHHFLMSGTQYDQEFSRISLGNLSHKKDGVKYDIFKSYLEEHYKEYPNIETVFES